MPRHRIRHWSVLSVALGFILTSCATTNNPPPRRWPAETPGSYPGRTYNTRNGEWWFPSQIGPKAIPPQGGNRGTLFYLRGEPVEPAAPMKTVQRVVYRARFVDTEVRVERLIFPAITFDENSARLGADATEQVGLAASAIREAAGHNVIIEGHNDRGESTGIDRQRADTVRAALVRLGIPDGRLTMEGYGDTRRLSDRETPLGHELNRRVTFALIPKGLDLNPQAPEDDPMPEADVRVETVVKQVTIERPRLVYDNRLIFPRILFNSNKADLRPDAEARVARASQVAQSLDDLRSLTVVGHCDSRGSDAHNQALSERRANTVRDYLEADGMSARKLAAEGRGEAEPIATNDTDDGRQLNRRVEFRVTYGRR